MIRPGLSAAVALAVLLETPLSAQQQLSVGEIVRTNKEAVVFIKVSATDANGVPKEAEATGFLVSAEGHMITARHILHDEDGGRFEQYSIEGAPGSRFEFLREIEPAPLAEEASADLMLLKFQGNRRDYKMVQVCGRAGLGLGDPLVTLGFPKGSELSVIDGVLSNTSAEQGMYQTNVDFTQGYSGGPVFGQDGAVVGVVMGGTAGVAGRNFFAPISDARNLLDRLPVRPQCDEAETAGNKPEAVQAGSKTFSAPGGIASETITGGTFTITNQGEKPASPEPED